MTVYQRRLTQHDSGAESWTWEVVKIETVSDIETEVACGEYQSLQEAIDNSRKSWDSVNKVPPSKR